MKKSFFLRVFFLLLFLISFLLLLIKEGNYTSLKNYSPFIPKNLVLNDVWYKIYFQRSQVGYSHFFFQAQNLKKKGGYLLKNDTSLKLLLLGKIEPLTLKAEIELNPTYKLKQANLSLNTSYYKLLASLVKKKNYYEITLKTPSLTTTRIVSENNNFISSLFSPIVFPHLPYKKKITYKIYDPFFNRHMLVSLKGLGKEYINIEGRRKLCYKMKIDIEGQSGFAYVDKNARLLREDFLGFSFIKSNPYEIFSKRSQPLKEVYNYFSLPSGNIPAPDKLKYLKVRIFGIDKNSLKEDFNQEIKKEKDAYIIQIKKFSPSFDRTLKKINPAYLKDGDFVVVNNPLIKKTAHSIVGDEREAFKKLVKIYNWLQKNIKKLPTITIPNTLDTLKLRRGDCGEISALMCGLLRAVGVPSYVNIGIVYYKGKFFFHAWVSAYVGGWIDTDPALEQLIADPTHIKFFEGLSKQFELFKIVSQLKIDILDYR